MTPVNGSIQKLDEQSPFAPSLSTCLDIPYSTCETFSLMTSLTKVPLGRFSLVVKVYSD